MPVTYYFCKKRPTNFSLETVRGVILYKACREVMSLDRITDKVQAFFKYCGREVPAHTIRARISELVASGDLIRLIDARYAHDEAMRQQSRAMQALKKAWKEKCGGAANVGVVPCIDEPVVRRRRKRK